MTSNPPVVYCPGCGRKAIRKMTKHGIRDDCWDCDLHSWAGKPLSTTTTLNARSAAHNAFDPIWRELKLVSRSKAYRLLSEELNLTRDECHMSLMDEETALRVPEAAGRIKAKLAERTPDEETQDFRERDEEVRKKRNERSHKTTKQTRGNTRSQLTEQLKEQRLAFDRDMLEATGGDTSKASRRRSDARRRVQAYPTSLRQTRR